MNNDERRHVPRTQSVVAPPGLLALIERARDVGGYTLTLARCHRAPVVAIASLENGRIDALGEFPVEAFEEICDALPTSDARTNTAPGVILDTRHRIVVCRLRDRTDIIIYLERTHG